MPPQPRYPSRRTLAPQGAPAGLCASTYELERAAAICRRVAAGESLRAICDRDPAMPTGKTVWNWRCAHPEFALMLNHAQGVARSRSLAGQAAADAAQRDARAATRKAPGRSGRPSGFDPWIWEDILSRMIAGEGLTKICADPTMPCAGTVYGWMRARPELVADYRCARAATPDCMVEMACARLPWIGERASWPMLRRTVRDTERLAARLTPKRYAPLGGPEHLTAMVQGPDGGWRVVYGDEPPGFAPRNPNQPGPLEP